LAVPVDSQKLMPLLTLLTKIHEGHVLMYGWRFVVVILHVRFIKVTACRTIIVLCTWHLAMFNLFLLIGCQ